VHRDIKNLHILQEQLKRLGIPNITHLTNDGERVYIHTDTMLTEEHEIQINEFMATYEEIDTMPKEIIPLITTKQSIKSSTWAVIASFEFKGLASQDLKTLELEAQGRYWIRIYDVTNHKVNTISNEKNNEAYTMTAISLDTDKLSFTKATIEIQIKTIGQTYIKSMSVSN
jgi:hypothetical protein